MDGIEVHVERKADSTIWLRYHADARLTGISFPKKANAGRQDGLWQSTCFEMFVREPNASDYVEFNFSPSSNWAAYHFDDYRHGMGEQAIDAAPAISLDASDGHIAFEANLLLPAPWSAVEIEIALAAVIEETGGTKSYWALAHPPGQPDFHHPDCFQLTLAAPKHA